jgi:UDP-glucose 4-epimerase
MDRSFVRDDPQAPVLVVGAGFIGSHTAEALVARDVPTRVVTRSSPCEATVAALSGAELLIGDVSSSSVLARALTGVRHVVFCAGGLTPADSAASPITDIESSLRPLLAVLSALRNLRGVGITYLSSGGTVYGTPVRLPVDELHPTDPIVPYGVAKLAGEKYVSLFRQLYGVPGRILRCANVYGERQPHDRNQGVVSVLLEAIRTGGTFSVVGDGSVVRDYVYVRDVAGVITALVGGASAPSLLNVGSGQGVSVSDVIALVEEITCVSPRIENVPWRAFDVESIVLDISRLRESLSFEPTSLHDGIRWVWESLGGALHARRALPPAGVSAAQ